MPLLASNRPQPLWISSIAVSGPADENPDHENTRIRSMYKETGILKTGFPRLMCLRPTEMVRLKPRNPLFTSNLEGRAHMPGSLSWRTAPNQFVCMRVVPPPKEAETSRYRDQAPVHPESSWFQPHVRPRTYLEQKRPSSKYAGVTSGTDTFGTRTEQSHIPCAAWAHEGVHRRPRPAHHLCGQASTRGRLVAVTGNGARCR